MQRNVSLLLSTLLTFCIASGTATASVSNKVLTLTPTATHLRIDPGASASGELQVLNQGDEQYTVRVYTAPYSVRGEDYTPDFSPLPGKPKVSDWITLSASHGNITKGQTLTVRYQVRVPSGTAPGGYYAVAFVESKNGENKAGVTINQRLGEIFYICVNGTVQENTSIRNWSSPFLQAQPLTASLRLQNTGGVHTTVTASLQVTDLFNHTKHKLTTQKEVLPQTVRRLPLTWQKTPPLGLFKVSGTVELQGKTQQLPTKYVLVASPLIRAVFGTMVAMAIAYGAARIHVRTKHKNQDQEPA